MLHNFYRYRHVSPTTMVIKPIERLLSVVSNLLRCPEKFRTDKNEREQFNTFFKVSQVSEIN
jgi:hypothetical protein